MKLSAVCDWNWPTTGSASALLSGRWAALSCRPKLERLHHPMSQKVAIGRSSRSAQPESTSGVSCELPHGVAICPHSPLAPAPAAPAPSPHPKLPPRHPCRLDHRGQLAHHHVARGCGVGCSAFQPRAEPAHKGPGRFRLRHCGRLCSTIGLHAAPAFCCHSSLCHEAFSPPGPGPGRKRDLRPAARQSAQRGAAACAGLERRGRAQLHALHRARAGPGRRPGRAEPVRHPARLERTALRTLLQRAFDGAAPLA